MTKWVVVAWAIVMSAVQVPVLAGSAEREGKADEKEPELMSAETFSGLELRGIGPAITGGRVTDFAVDPNDRARYFVAVASGGVWKTVNGGTTFTPVFDEEGSYSIGCLAMDPNNPHVIWVGTGENNSQRSVSFGDGVYRTRDGGAHWENLGLKESEHIGMIRIDPRDSDTVYVAAQGPLWRSGGDRGLYKTTDGGASWERILHISDDTGVNEIHFDPRDPDVLYASAYQRRRRVWTLIDGGPESAIYKSTDAGANWRKIEHGLPEVDMGRIGMCVSPANPDIVYAIIEAEGEKGEEGGGDGGGSGGGVFRSTDRGESWDKRSDHTSTSPQYYNELVCDPYDEDRVYSLDTLLHVTEDGGKTFKPVPRQFRHVDDHALWIDPDNTDYLLVGCDGGVYESFDRGENWRFMSNMSLTQFYRVSVDDSEPFYFVYGGTQDNNSLGGPSRTISPAGIVNEDWFVTVGGDGYESQIDPVDPNIVYSQWQYGGLVRHDRRSGEIVDIKPRELPGEQAYRWNWDSPLLLSSHDHKRLYFAANRLFQSDDRGNSWRAISDDLTRRIDRNQLEVMGRIQKADAVAKHDSTSFYGSIIALTESPLVDGLIYVGTDDGLIQVTEDGGATWRRIETFAGVPDMTYVSCLTASAHDGDVVYATFDNHKNGDFKPYVLRSPDRGRTWKAIAGDLPERHVVYTLAEDHVSADLLFVGTEFGAFFTADGGDAWIELTGKMPTIAVRDIAIQRRESDVVLGTFGRGMYILDDYSPLRNISTERLESDSILFPVKTALRYIETSRLGGTSGCGSQGASYFAAANPPFGATFTYYLEKKLASRKEHRKELEKKADKEKKQTPLPSIEELRAEDEELEPAIVLIVRDEAGAIVRRIKGSRDKGMHRVNWDLRYPSSVPTVLDDKKDLLPWEKPPAGPLALPGSYTVTLNRQVDGAMTQLADPQSFEVVPLELATFTAKDRADVLAFRSKVARLRRAVRGASKAADEMRVRLDYLLKAQLDTPLADATVLADLHALDRKLKAAVTTLRGDRTRAKRNEPVPPSILDRVEQVAGNQWYVTSAPTKTQRAAYEQAGSAFAKLLANLRSLRDSLEGVEQRLETEGAPWTPGRFPDWQME